MEAWTKLVSEFMVNMALQNRASPPAPTVDHTPLVTTFMIVIGFMVFMVVVLIIMTRGPGAPSQTCEAVPFTPRLFQCGNQRVIEQSPNNYISLN